MALEVIGAGLSRTGTTSLKRALEHLGLGPCHHIEDAQGDERQIRLWTRVYESQEADWDELFKGFRSTTDTPGCDFYAQLSDHYADAKLILTVRDPERYADSVISTIFAAATLDVLAKSPAEALMRASFRFALPRLGISPDPAVDPLTIVPTREQLLREYHTHNTEVRRRIAADRLLVFDVAQGWEPLCAFLGKPVPARPFPNANNIQQFHHNLSDIDGRSE